MIIFNRVEEILSTDIWFHFQFIEISLRGNGICLVAVKMTLKKNLTKKGVWQMFSHSFTRIIVCPIPLE